MSIHKDNYHLQSCKIETFGDYKVYITPHFEMRMRLRNISLQHIRDCLYEEVHQVMMKVSKRKTKKYGVRKCIAKVVSSDRLLILVFCIVNGGIIFITTYQTWFSDYQYMLKKANELSLKGRTNEYGAIPYGTKL